MSLTVFMSILLLFLLRANKLSEFYLKRCMSAYVMLLIPAYSFLRSAAIHLHIVPLPGALRICSIYIVQYESLGNIT